MCVFLHDLCEFFSISIPLREPYWSKGLRKYLIKGWKLYLSGWAPKFKKVKWKEGIKICRPMIYDLGPEIGSERRLQFNKKGLWFVWFVRHITSLFDGTELFPGTKWDRLHGGTRNSRWVLGGGKWTEWQEGVDEKESEGIRNKFPSSFGYRKISEYEIFRKVYR